MHGKARKEIHEMNKAMLGKDGAFDKFAGEDGVMNIEEARIMNKAMKKGFAAKLGEKVPDYPKGHFKKIFDAYDHLSPKVEGFTKRDSRVGQKIMEWIRDHRITEEEIDTYYPMGEMIYDEIDDLDDGNTQKKFFMNSLKKPDDKKMIEQFHKMFDSFDKDHNGSLNHREWKKMYNAGEKMGEKMLGSKGPDFSEGDKRFFWIMSDAISDGKWNAKHRKNGHGNVTWRDEKRLGKILKKVYLEVQEDEAEDEAEEAKDAKKEEFEDLFLF